MTEPQKPNNEDNHKSENKEFYDALENSLRVAGPKRTAKVLEGVLRENPLIEPAKPPEYKTEKTNYKWGCPVLIAAAIAGTLVADSFYHFLPDYLSLSRQEYKDTKK
ncbi:MAG: hypothetical protein EPN86_03510 [Nanoarchaeota archaeon]|nr:MAG: hypothetical protein EPN86_03510 [Nanoarchaeota archaeon]